MTHEDDMIIETTDFNDEKRQALEVTETARDKNWDLPSFGRQLFLGTLDESLIKPFPTQTQEDYVKGSEYIKEVESYFKGHLDPEKVDSEREIPQEVMDKMAELGVFAMKIPTEYDGLGFTQVNYNRVMSAISSYCGSTAVLVSAHQSIGVPQPLKMFGTKEQKEKYLPMFRKGAISAFALTEPEVGSDPAKMITTATPTDDGHYIINGKKLWCSNGPIADVMVVMAQTPPKTINGKERKQITAFIVEKKFGGINVDHRCSFLGLGGLQNGLLNFDNVKVPKENIILGEGQGLKLALSTLNVGRLTLPAACTGMAKQCLNIVRRWGNEREQWGDKIGNHESGQMKISSIASNTFAMDAVTKITSHWADQGDRDIRIEAAMAKLFCSEAAWDIIDTTLQFRGGRGYETATSLKGRGETPFPVERMMRECRINRIIEGTTDIMQLFLSREALDHHLNLASDLLKKKTTLTQKGKALCGMIKFYSTWYPKQFLSFDNVDSNELSKEFKYLKKQSRKLARTIFHSMLLYQDKLEQRQHVLGVLMNIGTQLFAMASTCSYALTIKSDNPNVIELAELFCRDSRRKICDWYKDLSIKTKGNRELSDGVMNGNFAWLEDDIMKID
jgi:alkylation response protein AidB-like acyl-CoA dehydrogenase